jgi:hypothetical protein
VRVPSYVTNPWFPYDDPPAAQLPAGAHDTELPGSATCVGLRFFRCSVDLEMLSSYADM